MTQLLSTPDYTDARLSIKHERWDDLTEEYRAGAARIASFQALAEFIGVLPFSDWLIKVPDFARKQMLTAKIQDEVGHGHVMARVAEDLGVTREQILWDFVEGRTRLLNIFHYGIDDWEELGPAALLQNSAAIVQFQSLTNGTYLPYVRALKKIEKEEAFHYHHAWDLTHDILTTGTPAQREIVQKAFETWLVRVLGYFGPPDLDTIEGNRMWQMGIKVDANETLRQRWLSKIIPVFVGLGVEVRPDLVRYDEDLKTWVYTGVDWAELKEFIARGGPRYGEWVERVKSSLTRNGRYARLALADAS